MPVPDSRIRAANLAPVDPSGEFVLYWMIALRRTEWSFALDRAVEHSVALGRPLVILEALRAGYPWASDRLHRFAIDGMRDQAEACSRAPVIYYPYIEMEVGAGKGLLEALAARAAVVVTDDYPAFFIPRIVETAASRVQVKLEAVDSNGLLPIRTADKAHPTAFSFRRSVQRQLRANLEHVPSAAPLRNAALPAVTWDVVPQEIKSRWPPVEPRHLEQPDDLLARLPIDHRVSVAQGTTGGTAAARERLREFLATGLPRYGSERNQPEQDVTSGLSAYLHFGQISAHEIFAAVMTRDGWTTRKLGETGHGQREGWWGTSPDAEGFLDQLVTWRELGFNMCALRPDDHDAFESLPAWARATLALHAGDPRPHLYSLRQFEEAATHDPLWNAAQVQLVREGRLHNYMRMLWGKKILEWSRSPQDALDTMIELNNKYALDGRDPNSYSGIFWVLGRYDRPWAPERPIFGSIRYMSSDNTARKLRVKDYVRRYSPDAPRLL